MNAPQITDVVSASKFILYYLNVLVPILFGVAIIVFFLGVIRYIRGGKEGIVKGRDQIVYGIIGLSVMFGIWGFLTIFLNTFFPSGVPGVRIIPGSGDFVKYPNDTYFIPDVGNR